MSKRSYERRIQRKREAERQARRRQRRMRLLRTWGSVVVALGLGVGLFLAFSGGGDGTATSPSPGATATASPSIRSYAAPPPMTIDGNKLYLATLDTSMGKITVRMDPKLAPKTVNNFVFLARDDFYDGTIFHRVIEDFMIQGGDPTGTGRGGPGYQFEDETDNGATFDEVGLLAMANAGPDTNGSQFFITVSTPSHLNGRHTIFGKVVSGYDLVLKISRVPTGAGDKPVEDVVIRDVSIREQDR